MSDPRPAKKAKTAASSALGTGEVARTPTACTWCREKKIKCTGQRPCQYCIKRSLDCVFPEPRKKSLYSVAYVQELERKLQASEQRGYNGWSEQGSRDLAIGDDAEARSSDERAQDSRRPSPPSWAAAEDGLSEDEPGNFDAGGHDHRKHDKAIIPDPVLSSSLNVGSHIKIISIHSGSTTSQALDRSFVGAGQIPDNAYNLPIQRSQVTHASCVRRWPTEQEAQDLLDLIANTTGQLWHPFEPRAASDRLANIYNGSTTMKIDTSDLWHVEMLMIFAFGSMLKGTLEEGEVFPGTQYFLEAIQYLPDPASLRVAGTMGLEILILIVLYLLSADRRNDAYIYAGVGARIALAIGLSRDDINTGFVRSERAHRTRLWWCMYMLERRLAAATGHPVTIQDNSIRIAMPIESPGFCSVIPLTFNIKIARITGRIMNTIYGPRDQSQNDFMSSVKEIVQSLFETARNMPAMCALDFSGTKLRVTRLKASLNMMLFQAIILATRPILLHLAKTRFQNNVDQSRIQKLAETCIQAAQRNYAVLHALRKQEIISKFGFFDLDALFSVALVFVVAETSFPSKVENQPSEFRNGINGSLEIINYLIQHGNRAAENRRADILQICSLAEISLEPAAVLNEQQQGSANGNPQVNSNGQAINYPTSYTGDASQQRPMDPRIDYQRIGAQQPQTQQEQDEMSMQNAVQNSRGADGGDSSVASGSGLTPGEVALLNLQQQLPYWEDDSTSISDLFAGHAKDDMYSLYCNDYLPPVGAGVTQIDWRKLEREMYHQ